MFMVKSAYIHIPFCRQKCRYCSFVSFPLLERKNEYLNALKQQVSFEYKGDELQTLYLGGGTPSLLSVKEIDELLSLFSISSGAEVTIEINPETVDEDYFRELAKTCVNRLSIGSQSFDDNILDVIGRRHKAEDVFRVVKDAQNAGFDNISLDFIYGLPNQSLDSFVADLKIAVGLGIQHISLYGLKIEEGCYFYNHIPKNLADDELQVEMYYSAVDFLTSCGFEHYEISNFSFEGKYSRHNVNYWKNQEYYGFGLAAHGYVDGVRYSNAENFEIFLSDCRKKDFVQNLSVQERLEEEIFLGLRLLGGINIANINKKYFIDFEDRYKKVLKKHIANGLLVRINGVYKLTLKGVTLSNYVLADFIG